MRQEVLNCVKARKSLRKFFFSSRPLSLILGLLLKIQAKSELRGKTKKCIFCEIVHNWKFQSRESGKTQFDLARNRVFLAWFLSIFSGTGMKSTISFSLRGNFICTQTGFSCSLMQIFLQTLHLPLQLDCDKWNSTAFLPFFPFLLVLSHCKCLF